MQRIIYLLVLLSLIPVNLLSSIAVDTIAVNEKGIENLLIEILAPSPEAIAGGVPSGALTYRMFIDLEPGYKLISIGGVDYATPPIDLVIQSTEIFYNNSFGSEKGQSANPLLFPAFPALEYDSYVSDGRIGSNQVGVLYSFDLDGTVNGRVSITPETTPAGEVTIPAPLTVLTDDTSKIVRNPNVGWGIPGGTVGPDPSTNIVFTGQLTTAGELKLILNIFTSDPYGNLRVANSVSYPAPEPPLVDIVSPANGSVFNPGTLIPLVATASYTKGIDSVVFYVNDLRIGSSINNPYSVNWTPELNGFYTIIAKVFDIDHVGGADTINVSISNLIPPFIQLVAPVEGDTFYSGQTIAIKATAFDPDGLIDSVQYFINGLRRGIDLEADADDLYQFNWIALTGSNHIEAVAWDNDGQVSSDTVNIHIKSPDVPDVKITSPEAGVVIVAGDTLIIAVTVTDLDSDVDSVEFFIDNIKIGISYEAPYSFSWPSVEGVHIVKAVAKDARGLSGSASHVFSALPNEAPVASIQYPEDSLEVRLGEEIVFQVIARDDQLVDSVEFFIEESKIGTDAIPENDSLFSISWSGTKGRKVLKVRATDTRGLTGPMDSVVFFVVNAPPVITLTSPSNEMVIAPGTELIISANASDPDGTVDSVLFMINSVKYRVLENEPYEITWTTVDGSYTITAIAFDNHGAKSEASVRITVSFGSGVQYIENNLIMVYPNPADQFLNISVGKEILDRLEYLEVVSNDGRIVLARDISTTSEERIEIDLTGFSTGHYILILKGTGLSFSREFIKQ